MRKLTLVPILFAFALVFSAVSPITISQATAESDLTTCISLSTQKERILKEGSCIPTRESTVYWHLTKSDSSIGDTATSKSLKVCSASTEQGSGYRLIRKKCGTNQYERNYFRSLSAPSQPVITSVEAISDSSVRVTILNSEVGIIDAPITYYTITTGNTSKKNISSSQVLIISGLNPSTEYVFSITATSANGTSMSSIESKAVTTKAFIAPVQSSQSSGSSSTPGPTFSVGDTGPGGGIVFYVSVPAFTMSGAPCGTNCHYLEWAPTSWASSDYSNAIFGASNDFYGGGTGSALGTGYSNTVLLATANAGTGYAVLNSDVPVYVRAYRGGGQSDWFLPSWDETLLISNSSVFSTGGFANDYYWSSTANSAGPGTSVQLHAITSGVKNDPGLQPIYRNFPVRPIRAG